MAKSSLMHLLKLATRQVAMEGAPKRPPWKALVTMRSAVATCSLAVQPRPQASLSPSRGPRMRPMRKSRLSARGSPAWPPPTSGGVASRTSVSFGARLSTRTPLVEIRQMADGRFRLIFANGAGTFDHVYDRVILTIPFAVMRAAVDFAKAGFSPLTRRHRR